jgi:stringent starvation protein B
MDNDAVHFHARFGGVSREIYVPVNNVLAIYANENGQGMAFEVTAPAADAAPAVSTESAAPTLSSVPTAPAEKPAPALSQIPDGNDEPPKKGGRPTLTVIK